MKRELIRTNAFARAAKRFFKKNPSAASDVEAALMLLSEDAFDSRLRTHKLKGELDGAWSASAGYDVRIVFEFVEHKNQEAILLLSLGTHDEVY